MTEHRINKVGLILGKRGCGKTTFLKEQVMPFIRQKILIVDTLDHPSYRHIPAISTKDLARWKSGTYRIFGSNTDEILNTIAANVYNALLVFEDAAKYLDNRLQEDVRNFVIDSKQKNLDIFFMFHGWGFVPPDLYRLADFITFFKTADNPASRKNYIPVYDMIKDDYAAIMQSPNPYINQTIELY